MNIKSAGLTALIALGVVIIYEQVKMRAGKA